ncbi:hypothetical protein B5S30_g140 [[Candida] boidinii]|nr:hypothetical protein B5S30_g140 [[Candida] boidinii]
MASIKRISQSSRNSITSSSSIFSSVSVIKELVDNSIDAFQELKVAKNLQIDIELDQASAGLKYISVKDNGSGVTKRDRPLMCCNFTTSKIDSFENISDKGVKTLGFRGEALFFISQLSEVTIVSKTKDDKLGEIWSINSKNGLPNSIAKQINTNIGTTVLVKKLFNDFPVRKKMLRKESKKTIDSLIDLIFNYSISYPNIRFNLRLISIHPTNDQKTTTIQLINFQPNLNIIKSLLNFLNLKSTFSSKFFNEIFEFESIDNNGSEYNCSIDLVLPKSRAQDMNLPSKLKNKNLKILSVNNRPLSNKLQLFKDINKTVNKVYSECGLLNPSIWVMKLKLPITKIDVNIEPEKSDILINNLNQFLIALKDELKLKVLKNHDIDEDLEVVESNLQIQTNNESLFVEPVSQRLDEDDIVTLDKHEERHYVDSDTIANENLDDAALIGKNDHSTSDIEPEIDIMATAVENLQTEQEQMQDQEVIEAVDKVDTETQNTLLEFNIAHTQTKPLENIPLVDITNDDEENDWSFTLQDTVSSDATNISSQPIDTLISENEDVSISKIIELSNPFTIAKLSSRQVEPSNNTEFAQTHKNNISNENNKPFQVSYTQKQTNSLDSLMKTAYDQGNKKYLGKLSKYELETIDLIETVDSDTGINRKRQKNYTLLNETNWIKRPGNPSVNVLNGFLTWVKNNDNITLEDLNNFNNVTDINEIDLTSIKAKTETGSVLNIIEI